MGLTIDGILKHTGPQKHLRLKKIVCEVQCKAEGPEKLKEMCFKEFKEHCIVSNSLGIPIDIKIQNT